MKFQFCVVKNGLGIFRTISFYARLGVATPEKLIRTACKEIKTTPVRNSGAGSASGRCIIISAAIGSLHGA